VFIVKISDLMWRASDEEIKNGFMKEEGNYVCIICGEEIEEEKVYSAEGASYKAEEYMQLHIKKVHGSSFAVLQEIADEFQRGQAYTEKEVNQILKAVNDDYVTVRRYLIEYGYLDRKPDGSQYWLKENRKVQ
jgi:hypothetical protein